MSCFSQSVDLISILFSIAVYFSYDVVHRIITESKTHLCKLNFISANVYIVVVCFMYSRQFSMSFTKRCSITIRETKWSAFICMIKLRVDLEKSRKLVSKWLGILNFITMLHIHYVLTAAISHWIYLWLLFPLRIWLVLPVFDIHYTVAAFIYLSIYLFKENIKGHDTPLIFNRTNHIINSKT